MSIIIASTHVPGGPNGATSTAYVRGLDTAKSPVSLTSVTELRASSVVMSRSSIKAPLSTTGVTAIEDAIRASGLLDISSVAAPAAATSIDLGNATRDGALAVRIDDRMWTSRDTPDAINAMKLVIEAIDKQGGPVQS